MKYRRTDYEYFDDIVDALECFCGEQDDCDNCAIGKIKTDDSHCWNFVTAHPYESAKAMRIEVIEDEFDKCNNTSCDKPRLCKVLGVEPDEVFAYDFDGTRVIYRVHNGTEQILDKGHWLATTEGTRLCKMINHPENIVREKLWSIEDINDAAAILRIHDFQWAARNADGTLVCYEKEPALYNHAFQDPEGYLSVKVRSDLFPSLYEEEKAKLLDIMGQRKYTGLEKKIKNAKSGPSMFDEIPVERREELKKQAQNLRRTIELIREGGTNAVQDQMDKLSSVEGWGEAGDVQSD